MACITVPGMHGWGNPFLRGIALRQASFLCGTDAQPRGAESFQRNGKRPGTTAGVALQAEASPHRHFCNHKAALLIVTSRAQRSHWSNCNPSGTTPSKGLLKARGPPRAFFSRRSADTATTWTCEDLIGSLSHWH